MHIYSITINNIALTDGGFIDDHQGFYENLNDAVMEAEYHARKLWGEFHALEGEPKDLRGDVVVDLHNLQFNRIITVYREEVISESAAARIRSNRAGNDCFSDWQEQELAQMQAIDDFFDELSY